MLSAIVVSFIVCLVVVITALISEPFGEEIPGIYTVSRTVSLPIWMDKEARRAGLSLSHTLQDALTDKLTPAQTETVPAPIAEADVA